MHEIRVPALLTCVGGHLARYSVDILCFAGVFVFIVHFCTLIFIARPANDDDRK